MAFIITLITAVFTGGVTWGIVSTRQKSDNTTLNAIASRLETLTSRLETLVVEIQVAKSVGARVEKDLEAHDDRIRELETQVAKLSR